jgi:thiol-disulfide isomerase/thioredoxin
MKNFLKKIINWRPNWKVLARDLAILVTIFILLDFWQRRNLIESGQEIGLDALQWTDTQQQRVEWKSEGRPTLLYFFAPWCGVCKVSMGDIQEKLDDYGLREKINVAFIALDYETIGSVVEFQIENNIIQPILLGTEQTRDDFAIDAYPTIYILDKENRVVSHRVGYTPIWLIFLKTFMYV